MADNTGQFGVIAAASRRHAHPSSLAQAQDPATSAEDWLLETEGDALRLATEQKPARRLPVSPMLAELTAVQHFSLRQ